MERIKKEYNVKDSANPSQTFDNFGALSIRGMRVKSVASNYGDIAVQKLRRERVSRGRDTLKVGAIFATRTWKERSREVHGQTSLEAALLHVRRKRTRTYVCARVYVCACV